MKNWYDSEGKILEIGDIVAYRAELLGNPVLKGRIQKFTKVKVQIVNLETGKLVAQRSPNTLLKIIE